MQFFLCQTLSVALARPPQVLTPALTMAVCAVFGLERLTAPLLTSVTLITLGTGVATAVEVWPSPLFLFPRFPALHILSAQNATLISCQP